MAATSVDAPGVLLVHGFWHGSWCWSRVAADLVDRGGRVLAVDLAGHGLEARLPASTIARPFDAAAFATEVSPVGSVDLDEAGDRLVAQIEAFASGEPVVVVGHSFGGAVLTRAVQAVPDLVRHVVYVCAIMPASGVPGVAYLRAPEQNGDRIAPLLCGDPMRTGALRLDVGGSGRYRALLRDALYADVDPDVADAATALLTPDAPVGIALGATTLTEDRWGSVPRSYVHCARDAAIRPALQRRFVTDADLAYPTNPTEVVELQSAHSPFLSVPGLLADVIAGASH